MPFLSIYNIPTVYHGCRKNISRSFLSVRNLHMQKNTVWDWTFFFFLPFFALKSCRKAVQIAPTERSSVQCWNHVCGNVHWRWGVVVACDGIQVETFAMKMLWMAVFNLWNILKFQRFTQTNHSQQWGRKTERRCLFSMFTHSHIFIPLSIKTAYLIIH